MMAKYKMQVDAEGQEMIGFLGQDVQSKQDPRWTAIAKYLKENTDLAPKDLKFIRRVLITPAYSAGLLPEPPETPREPIVTPRYYAGLLPKGADLPYAGMRPSGRSAPSASTPSSASTFSSTFPPSKGVSMGSDPFSSASSMAGMLPGLTPEIPRGVSTSAASPIGNPLEASSANTGQVYQILSQGVPEKNGVPTEYPLASDLQDLKDKFVQTHKLLKPAYQKQLQELVDQLDDKAFISNPKNIRTAQLKLAGILENGKNFNAKYFPGGVKATGKTALLLGLVASVTAMIIGMVKSKEQQQQEQMSQLVDLERAKLSGMNPEVQGMKDLLPFMEKQGTMLTQANSGATYEPQPPVNTQVLKMLMAAGGGQQP